MYFYYVYILNCSDESYYTGIKNNIDKRYKEHKQGIKKDCYTFKRRPLSLQFHQEFNNVLQAIFFEKKIKRWTHAKKKALINGDYNLLQILSEFRNATHYKYKN